MSSAETFISVDIEASGPVPGEYSMLSIGACLVDSPEQRFHCELKPTSQNFVPEALKVTGLTLEELAERGLTPQEGMQKFARWVSDVSAKIGGRPVFVGLNAPFDWAFVNYYFHRYAGDNPFGFTALDIKAYFMGATGSAWKDTRSSVMAAMVRPESSGDHNALNDALYQAELFRLLRARFAKP